MGKLANLCNHVHWINLYMLFTSESCDSIVSYVGSKLQNWDDFSSQLAVDFFVLVLFSFYSLHVLNKNRNWSQQKDILTIN